MAGKHTEKFVMLILLAFSRCVFLSELAQHEETHEFRLGGVGRVGDLCVYLGQPATNGQFDGLIVLTARLFDLYADVFGKVFQL